MDVTPKKLVESSSKCFVCSSASLKKHKVYIFGKSSLDIAGIIRSSLTVDVSRYSENGELFVCKDKCYKALVKFQRASDKLKEIKQEMEEVFNSREIHRAKRLLRSEVDEGNKSGENFESFDSRGKASKSLRFSDSNTTCTSFKDTDVLAKPISACRTPLIPCLCPIQSHHHGLVLRAFPNSQPYGGSQRTVMEFPLPRLSSTPVSYNHGSTSTRDTTEVKLSIHYPSKNVNKTLSVAYQSIGKTLAHGIPSQIAGAVMNCEPLRKHITERVLKVVSKEVSGLCSKNNPSLLRKSEKVDLEKFDLELVCNEWRVRAPVFYSFPLTSCINKRTKNSTWFGSLALAGSILLKQRNEEMSSTAYVIGVLLKTKAIEATISRFSKLKLTNSNSQILAKLDKLGQNHDADLMKAKERICLETSHLKQVQEKYQSLLAKHASHSHCTSVCHDELASTWREVYELKKTSHPGFVISFDNLDIHLQRKNMTMQSQNQDFHWVNHQMVENRVSGAQLDSQEPKANLQELSNLKFLPSIEDQQRQRSNYIILTSRVLVNYFKVLEPLKESCVQHIPHKYTNELSKKSKKTPLGIIFKNENVNEDMLEILQQFHSYLPQTCDGGIDGQLFSGDQLTVERAVNVIASVANGLTPQDRLEGMNLQLGDWHAAVKLLSLIYSRFFSGTSDIDSCTLFADRTLINRRNVTGDPHSSYRANRDFLSIVFQSRVIVAAMKVLGFENQSGIPTKHKLPNLELLKKSEKLNCLNELSAKVVDEFVFQNSSVVNDLVNNVMTVQERDDLLQRQELTPEGRFPCRFPACDRSFKYNGKSRRSHELSHEPPVQVEEDTPTLTPSRPVSPMKETKAGDDVLSYNSALLTDSFPFFNFLDAIKEGDGLRILRQYKYIMLYCKADGSHSTKYSLECLYQFFLVYALLSPRDSERFTWNRTVNNAGKSGANIPLDEDTEHSNNFSKQGIKNLGPNVTEKAVSRLSYSESPSRVILGNLDEAIRRMVKSGKHSEGSTARDLHELVKKAVLFNIFTEFEGRTYKQFCNFQRDRLNNLNASSLHRWINMHKKNITWGIRAR